MSCLGRLFPAVPDRGTRLSLRRTLQTPSRPCGVGCRVSSLCASLLPQLSEDWTWGVLAMLSQHKCSPKGAKPSDLRSSLDGMGGCSEENAPLHPLQRGRALGTAGYCRSHPGCAFHLGTELLGGSFPLQSPLPTVGCVSMEVFSAAKGHELLRQHRHTVLCLAWGQQGPCAAIDAQEVLHQPRGLTPR